MKKNNIFLLNYTLIIFSFLLLSCEKYDGLAADDYTIHKDSETSINFEELVMLINIKLPNNNYLVVKSIDSLNIYINNKHWAKINSTKLDIDNLNKTTNNNRFESKSKVNYLVLAKNKVKDVKFETAGDYAKYLNSDFNIKPGQYACCIKSFRIKYNDNTTKTYYPNKYCVFNVEAGKRSSYSGEIELNIEP